MATILLIIIYFAFISLGLPDSLLGAAWPVIQVDFEAPLEAAGLLAMTIAGSTIISSLFSGTVLNWLGTGKVTLISCLMTAVSLLGYAYSPSFIWFIIFSVPLGLGAGAIDTGLNNYVATHYKAHHMSWLHSFWGVGATLGPIIMSQFIGDQHTWKDGYFAIAMIQFSLVILLFFTLPLWKRVGSGSHVDNAGQGSNDTVSLSSEESAATESSNKKKHPLQIKGVKLSLIAFLFYCGAEATMGLWGSSYLVDVKGLSAATAAQWVSLYYGGITIGRFITGFITMRVNNRTLIRAGQIIALFGAVLLLLPLPAIVSLIGFILVGVGCAPIFPCMLHETPARFGREHSQKIMGFQMAFAYTGITFLPPLLGTIAAQTTIAIFPFLVCAYILLMLAAAEIVYKPRSKSYSVLS